MKTLSPLQRAAAIDELAGSMAELAELFSQQPESRRAELYRASASKLLDQVAAAFDVANVAELDRQHGRQERRRLLVQLTAGILANPNRLHPSNNEEQVALAYLRDIQTLLEEMPAGALSDPAPRGSVVLVLVFWRETVRSGLVNDRLDQVIVCDSWDQARLVERAYKRADRHITVEEKAVQDFLSERGGRNV